MIPKAYSIEKFLVHFLSVCILFFISFICSVLTKQWLSLADVF